MPRPAGRPSKLTPETTQKLVEALEQGETYAVACADAGLTYRSFRHYMVKGEAAEQGEYFHFFHKMNAALMVGRGKMEARAFKESKPLAWLERRYPEDWGRKDRAEIGGPIVVRVEWATDKDKKEEEG